MKILEFDKKKEKLIIEENGKKKKYTIWHVWHTNDGKHTFFECNPYSFNIIPICNDKGFAPIFANIGVMKYLMGDVKNHPFKYEDKKTRVLVVSEDGTMFFGDEAVDFFDSLVLAEKLTTGNTKKMFM